MPTIDVVMLEDIAAHVAATIKQVNDAVVIARASGIQAELPPKIDFQINVVAKWQDLALSTSQSGVNSEDGTTQENGKTTGKEGGEDKRTSISEEGGYQIQTENSTTKQSDLTTTSGDTLSTQRHLNSGERVTVTED